MGEHLQTPFAGRETKDKKLTEKPGKYASRWEI